MEAVEPGADPAAHWRRRDSDVLSPAYSRYSDIVVDRAEGAHLHTVDGRDVIDLGSGIGVTSLGHLHPAVVRAVHEQVDRLWHTSVTAFHTRQVEAAEALVDVLPPGLDQVFLCNSGTEAVEGALKLARRATGRTEIVAFAGGFHGRTYGSLSLTASKAKYRRRMGPFLPGVHHVRYPYCLHTCGHAAGARCPIAEGEDLDDLFTTRVPPEAVAAMVVEPVLGEGGYVVPPPAFLPTLRRMCDEHGILLIADEVQSGFARTGRMFAVEHTGTRPDIMCLAKAMANGLPIGAIAASREVMGAWHPAEHGTTFGGNPIACAATIAVIETIRDEHLVERAQRLGASTLERVRGWMPRAPRIVEVRGLGLMIGIELYRADGTPAPEMVESIRRMALDGGVLVLNCGVDENVIRLAPPLTIPEEELDFSLRVLEEAVLEFAG